MIDTMMKHLNKRYKQSPKLFYTIGILGGVIIGYLSHQSILISIVVSLITIYVISYWN